MTGIYRVFHKDTQRSYIGQSVNILNRIFVHFHVYTIRNAKSLLAKGMKEFGKNEFDWEVVELCHDGVLDDRESVWIDALDPIFPNGYNLKWGGKHGKMAYGNRGKVRSNAEQLSLF